MANPVDQAGMSRPGSLMREDEVNQARGVAAASGDMLVVRVIARAHHWSRFNVAETKAQSMVSQVNKLLRFVEARDRQMIFGRPQILADGKDVIDALGVPRSRKTSISSSDDSPRPTITPLFVTMPGENFLAFSSSVSVRS